MAIYRWGLYAVLAYHRSDGDQEVLTGLRKEGKVMLALWLATLVVRSHKKLACFAQGTSRRALDPVAGCVRETLTIRYDLPSLAWGLAVLIWFAAIFVVRPLQAVPPPAPSPGKVSLSFSDDNGIQDLQWSEGGSRLEVHSEGKVDLNRDWTGVARLGDKARMLLVERAGDATRELEIRPGSLGRPVYTWRVDGKEHAFDAAGQAWLQGALLRFVRGSGYAADERSAAIFARQGPAGVLAEISQIPGDQVKRRFFAQPLTHRDLGAPAVEAALRQMGQQIGSDFLRASLLVAAAQSWDLGEAGAVAYIEALRAISSDHDRGRAASALIERERLSPANLTAVLQAAQGIQSDHERASLLVGIVGRYELSGGARAAYLEAAGSIRSKMLRERAEAALGEKRSSR